MKLVKALVCLALALVGGLVHSAEWTPYTTITQVANSATDTRTFRIVGPSSTACTGQGQGAYVESTDAAAKTIIATLLTAYAMGKQVSVYVEPVNYYGNGTNYCKILLVLTQG